MTKTITIKNAHNSDVEFLRQVQDVAGLTVAGALHKIIEENQSLPKENAQVNPEETEVYQSLLSVNQALTLQVEEQETAISGLQTENQSLLSVNRQLAQEKEILVNQAVTLKEPDFIFSPDAELAKKMRRVLVYLIKKGTLKKEDSNLPQRLTKFALENLIKTDYSHILK